MSCDQIAEHLWSCLRTRARHRRVHQVLQRCHAILRRLDGDVIAHAVPWIQPEIGGRLEASTQADQHALGDFLGIQSDLIDARAVHVEVERGQAHHLLHVHVGGAGNLAQPICDPLRDVVVPAHIGAHYLNIDRRGQAKIENLRHDIGGLEEKLHARKPRWEIAAQLAHVLRRRMMVFRIQRNQNLRIARPNHARTAVGKIHARVGHADIVQHRLQLFLRNLAAQHALHFIAQTRRLFHAQAGPGAEVQTNQARIHLRERNPAPERTPAPATENRKPQSRGRIISGARAWFPAVAGSRRGTFQTSARIRAGIFPKSFSARRRDAHARA